MRKKKLLILVAILAAIAAIGTVVVLVQCGGTGGENGNGGTGDGEKPSGDHTHSYIETVIEPTCTEKGYTLHKCECGDEYKDNEMEALGHLFGEWKTITPATEEKDGEETRACTRENCDYTETRKIPALNHTHSYAETVVEPTCTEKGYTLHKCECGDEYKDNETEALGHLFGEWKTITPATEGKDGEETRACTRDNCDYTETRKIPKLDHTHEYTETVVEPTCTTKGYTLHKCECGDEYKDNETEALGHLFGEWKTITPATEEKDGEETRACTRDNCDYTETRKIPALSHIHEYTETVVEPTCTEKGYTLHKCECGEEYKDNETEALGHLFGAWETITPATEDSEGLERRTCTRENCDFKEERKIPVLSHTHNYITTIVEPTCTERGYTKYTCEKCGNSYNADYKKALGHNFGEWKEIKPATEEEDGLKERTCARCGETEEQAIPAKTHEHKFVDTVIEPTCTERGYTIHKCKCGEQYEDSYVSALDHSYSTEWTIDKEATCTETGIKSHHCIRCSARTDETEIPLSKHNFVNGACTACGKEGLEEATGLEYTLSEDKTYYIITDLGVEYREKFAIPEEYNGLPVKEIGENAFRNAPLLKEIILSDNIEVIGDYAFYGCSMSKITLGRGLKRIGTYALEHSGNEKRKIVLPSIEDWLKIEDISTGISNTGYKITSTFYIGDAPVIEVVIPESIKSIRDSAFSYFDTLKRVTIHEGVTSIGKYAFTASPNLASITVSENNSVYSSKDGILYNKAQTEIICVPKGIRGNIVIPDSIKSIDDRLFQDCALLTGLTIPDSVTSLGSNIIGGCNSLESIVIGNGITYLNGSTFTFPSSLTKIILGNNIAYIEREIFRDCDKAMTTVNGVNYIGKWAISCDKKITEIELEADTEGIANGAFAGCSLLERVVIGNNVKKISEEAFRECLSLKTITIPDSVTSIGMYAFCVCRSLTNLIIPDSVTSIDNGAFNGCDKLIETVNGVGYVDKWAVSCDRAVTKVELKADTVGIAGWAFYCGDSLTSVTIPDSVTSIGYEAFFACSRLTDINYNGSMEEWNKIEKSESWNRSTGNYVVHCTDGDIKKS